MYYRKDIAHRELKRVKTDTSSEGKTALTYAEAGVSISAGNSLVERIKPFVKSTGQPWAGAEIGGFGGEVSLICFVLQSILPITSRRYEFLFIVKLTLA